MTDDTTAAGNPACGVPSCAQPSLLTIERLRDRPDFLKAARARYHRTEGFVLQARERRGEEADTDVLRVGFTCSKKVGNAVARNRAKRRLREAARLVLPDHGRAGWDYVLIGRARSTAAHPFERMLADLRSALSRLHG